MTTTANHTATARAEALHNIFVTALEGGINDWAEVDVYRWSKRDAEGRSTGESDTEQFTAIIYDVESPHEADRDSTYLVATAVFADGETYGKYVINRDVVARGARLWAEYAKDHSWDYAKQAARALRRGEYDDLDVDALLASDIVQFGLWGKAIYG